MLASQQSVKIRDATRPSAPARLKRAGALRCLRSMFSRLDRRLPTNVWGMRGSVSIAHTTQRRVPVTGARLSLWRAAALFRIVSLLFDLALIVKWQHRYAHPGAAWAVAVAMIAMTLWISRLAVLGRAHRWPVVVTDLVVTIGLTLASIAVQTRYDQHGHLATITTVWAAGPVIEASFLASSVGGVTFGLLQLGAALVVRHGYDVGTVSSGVLLIIVGGVCGVVARAVVRAEDELARAVAVQASLAERERLARSIHDGVLQVLGLVHRTGRGAGGRWEALATEAATQEAALRALISSRPVPTAMGVLDLSDELRALGRDRVTVSTPGEPILAAAATAREIIAAVRAALHNVDEHNGPTVRAWILLENLDDHLAVTIRDDGVGFEPERLVAAADQGHLGVTSSISGRMAGLGGTASVTSVPGAGTVVELRVPVASS